VGRGRTVRRERGDPGARPAVNRHRVAGAQEIPRHRRAHDAETDDPDPHAYTRLNGRIAALLRRSIAGALGPGLSSFIGRTSPGGQLSPPLLVIEARGSGLIEITAESDEVAQPRRAGFETLVSI